MSAGVYAGIGATRAEDLDRSVVEAAQCRLKLTLDRPLRALTSEAVKVASLVSQSQQARHKADGALDPGRDGIR